MDLQRQAIYKEWSPWPGWLLVMFWGSMLLSTAFVAVAPGESDAERTWGVGIVVAVAVVVQWLLAGLSVRLFRDEIVLGLGSSGWIRKRVRYDAIVRTESLSYQPLLEFGGWGIRWGKDGKKAWTARGSHAVVLHLVDGTRLYVGSDSPSRLEQRIRAIGGTRIGSSEMNATG